MTASMASTTATGIMYHICAIGVGAMATKACAEQRGERNYPTLNDAGSEQY
jgi:hypothetical protein